MTAPTAEMLRRLPERFDHAVLVTVDADGYPLSAAADFEVDEGGSAVRLRPPAAIPVGPGAEANVIFSHIRPQPDMGYDERRYVNLWGPLAEEDGGWLVLRPRRSQTWDEKEVPFFQYSELGVPQAHRYLGALGARQGRRIRPRLSGGWLFLRATRLPFLSATAVPVFLGVAVAALHGSFHLGYALLTLVAASLVHLGLNVANDIFDTLSGADAANTTPTQFSGGSRVIHYGLLSTGQMVALSAAFYAAAVAIGLYLAVERGFWPLFWIGLAGVAISVAYTAPPLRLVYRGLGEIAVALGFGPIMVLGAYFVQAQRLSAEAWVASIPVAILIALVLYVNEVPDRPGDGAAGKRTLPVRLSPGAVVAGYAAAAAAAYAGVVAGVATGILPFPTLLAAATAPMALGVYRGLRASYEDPYALMPTMAKGVNLHLFTGLLLVAGYVAAIVADRVMATPPFFLR
ncbi:MAG: prenyltransferase [Actinobacteria bacterium]|nr:prenyltransferase [Actinomycetota bacterium]